MNKTTTVGVEFRAYNRATTGLRSFTAGLNTLGRSVTRLGTTVMAAAGIGGLGYMLGQQLKSVDAIGKMSDELQISTRALAGWSHAAQISGTDIETLHKGLQIFVRRIGEARQGLGEARHGLTAIGMTADQLAQQGPERAFLTIAESIARLESATDRAQVAYAFFGRQGMNMLNLLMQGREGIAALTDEADRLGLTFSRFDAGQVEAANDALTRMRGAATGFGRTLTVGLSPAIAELADGVTQASESIGKYLADNRSAIKRWGSDMVEGFIAVGEAGNWLKEVFARQTELPDKYRNDAILMYRQTVGRLDPDAFKVTEQLGGGVAENPPKYVRKWQQLKDLQWQSYRQDQEDLQRARTQALRDAAAAIGTGDFPTVTSPGSAGAGLGTDGASALTEAATKTVDILAATARMYDEIDSRTAESYNARLALLMKQRREYELMGIDSGVVDTWYQDRYARHKVDRLKGGDSWQGGFQAAALESQRDMQTLGETGYDVATGWSDAFGNFFRQMRTGFNDLGEAAESLLDSLTSVLWEAMVVAPLKQSLTQMMPQLMPSANGNVFDRGRIVPFANGGIFAGPTVFPMGLAGEAGPEAILPLSRGPGGRLGVNASGTTPSVVIDIDNHSSAEASAEVGDVRFDGQRLIAGMVLRDRRNNGPMSRQSRRSSR